MLVAQPAAGPVLLVAGDGVLAKHTAMAMPI